MRWHNKELTLFNKQYYNNVLKEDHIHEPISLQKKTFWVAKYNKKNYLIEPYIRDVLPIKIYDEKEFHYCNRVYFIPVNPQVFNIKPDDSMTFRQLIDEFAEFEHSNNLDWTLYKLIIIGSYIRKLNCCIATDPQFGKDSLTTFCLEPLLDDYHVIYPKTAAKVKNMLEAKGFVITEFPDIPADKLNQIDPIIRIALDGRSIYRNDAMAIDKVTKDIYDVSKLSGVFIYNRYEDYIEHGNTNRYFDRAFKQATKERFFMVLLKGVLGVEQFNKDFNAKQSYSVQSRLFECSNSANSSINCLNVRGVIYVPYAPECIRSVARVGQ